MEVAGFAGTWSGNAGGSSARHLGDIKHDPAPLGGKGTAPVPFGGLAAVSFGDRTDLGKRHMVMEVRTLMGVGSLPQCEPQGSHLVVGFMAGDFTH